MIKYEQSHTGKYYMQRYSSIANKKALQQLATNTPLKQLVRLVCSWQWTKG